MLDVCFASKVKAKLLGNPRAIGLQCLTVFHCNGNRPFSLMFCHQPLSQRLPPASPRAPKTESPTAPTLTWDVKSLGLFSDSQSYHGNPVVRRQATLSFHAASMHALHAVPPAAPITECDVFWWWRKRIIPSIACLSQTSTCWEDNLPRSGDLPCVRKSHPNWCPERNVAWREGAAVRGNGRMERIHPSPSHNPHTPKPTTQSQ